MITNKRQRKRDRVTEKYYLLLQLFRVGIGMKCNHNNHYIVTDLHKI